MTEPVDGWLSTLGAEAEVVRRRIDAFRLRSGEAATALIDHWRSAPEGRRALQVVFALDKDVTTVSVDGLRLLLVTAAETGSVAGVESLLERLAAGPHGGAAFDLEALAAAITPHAVAERHPESILRAVVRWVLDASIPLFSLPALEGSARLAAAECRMRHAREDLAARAEQELAAGPLIGSALWKETVEGLGDDARGDRLEALSAALASEHVAELVGACRRDASGSERQATLALLGRLVTARDPRLGGRQRGDLAAALRTSALKTEGRDWTALRLWVQLDRTAAQRHLLAGFEASGALDRPLYDELLRAAPAEDERAAWIELLQRLNRLAFSRGTVLPEALAAWVHLDASASGLFLTSTLALAGLPTGPLSVVVGTLVRLGSPPAIDRLREVAGRSDAVGERARAGLEIAGAEPPVGIERLSAEWRQTRRSEALARLYNTYIEGLPAGTPFGPWRVRLGEPSSEVDGSLWYKSADGGYRLYLEVDREGRLRAWSLR